MDAQPSIIVVVVSAILTENFILTKFLGICPFLGVSKKVETAIGMSAAVLFVMTLASAITSLLWTYVLARYQLEFLRTIVFILVIASLVQLTEMAIAKFSQTLYQALGIFLPLITTNCAVLGLCVLNIDKSFKFHIALINGVSSAVGFGLALVIFAGLRERIQLARVPKPLEGAAIALITAGLLSLAFMGFSGIVKTG